MAIETGTHAPVWLHALLNSYPQHNQGQLYVERFQEACDELVKKGFLSGYVLYSQYSSQDVKGVDGKLIISGSEKSVQITSTLLQAEEHIIVSARNNRPPIPIFCIRVENSHLIKPVEELEEEILDTLIR